MSTESFSFGMMPPALLHAVGISCFCHTTIISLHKQRNTPGVFLYSRYGTPLGPGENAALV